MDVNNIYFGDCLQLMGNIPSGSIDMILCDLPYGTTRNKWDSVIDLPKLWGQYKRVIKENGAIVLTGKQPFTSIVITSNLRMYKYNLVWRKNLKTGNLNARKMPMGAFEDIMVFYKTPPTYNPQKIPRTFQVPSGNKLNSKTTNYGKQREVYIDRQSDWLMPDDVIDYEDAYPLDALDLENEMLYIKCLHNSSGKIHPTQKPVELFEYFIKTYTNKDDIVLDNCSGSGTTAIASINTNRNYICIDNDSDMVEKSKIRVSEHTKTINKSIYHE
jgi:site-specific DNA-methyltransferase (adenine-specific)